MYAPWSYGCTGAASALGRMTLRCCLCLGRMDVQVLPLRKQSTSSAPLPQGHHANNIARELVAVAVALVPAAVRGSAGLVQWRWLTLPTRTLGTSPLSCTMIFFDICFFKHLGKRAVLCKKLPPRVLVYGEIFFHYVYRVLSVFGRLANGTVVFNLFQHGGGQAAAPCTCDPDVRAARCCHDDPGD